MIDLAVSHLSKRYHVRRPAGTNGGRPSLGRRLQAFRRRSEEFWALRDVSFDVARGETLGIIGENGAGKSTILKVLSSVTAPTVGEVTISGRLSALIEIGSGFHPELTGRENIYLSGSILGMRRREITEKLDRIIEFAGVREFIDTSVKHYSSGMYLRLGFAIAAHLEPDILLLDEVLAVGDAAFQVKCFDRINEMHQQGRTIIFITHDLAAVERLCDRVLLLRRGQLVANGPARDVVRQYQEGISCYTPSQQGFVAQTNLSHEAVITSVSCHDADGRETAVFRTGSLVRVRASFVTHTPLPDGIIRIYVYSMIDGQYGPWFELTTASHDGGGMALEAGPGVVEFEVDALNFMPGIYYLTATIVHEDQPAGTAIEWQNQCLTLRVEPGRVIRGTFFTPHRWYVLPREQAPKLHDRRETRL